MKVNESTGIIKVGNKIEFNFEWEVNHVELENPDICKDCIIIFMKNVIEKLGKEIET